MSSAALPLFRLFVGVDVAAKTFTASWTSDRLHYASPQTVSSSAPGFSLLQTTLTATGIAPAETLIVLEATGSYWMAIAVALHSAGFAVSGVNPRHVYHWAQSLPRRSNTDPLDARMLAQFAAERQPPCWTPPPDVYHQLRQRLSARDALRELRQQARNQRHSLLHWPVLVTSVVDHFDAVIADLDKRIASLETEIAHVLEQGDWSESAALLESITGIGLVTTAWLLVLTVNVTRCANAAALTNDAGLTPLLRESGTSIRGRAGLGHSGHVRLRTVMYLATLSAARHNRPIKVFYERLRAAGKPVQVARCAAARKLLEMAYAVVKNKRPFDPGYQTCAVAEPLNTQIATSQ